MPLDIESDGGGHFHLLSRRFEWNETECLLGEQAREARARIFQGEFGIASEDFPSPRTDHVDEALRACRRDTQSKLGLDRIPECDCALRRGFCRPDGKV